MWVVIQFDALERYYLSGSLQLQQCAGLAEAAMGRSGNKADLSVPISFSTTMFIIPQFQGAI
jgi:hypothetical protein